MRIGLNVVATATVLGLAGLGRAATAEEGVEARLRALERRVERLEREVKEKDAVIERLRERLGQRAPDGQPLPPPVVPPGVRPGLPFNWPPDQFGDLQDRVRKEVEKWGLEWGLPGRELRPDRGPRELLRPGRGGRALLGIEMGNERGNELGGGGPGKRVLPGSAAEKAGLAAGDELVAIDGHPVATPMEVKAIVDAHEPGDEIALRVRRAGDTLTMKAKLASREAGAPTPMPRWRFGPARPRWRGLPGRDEEKGPDRAKRDDSIEVEVTVPGGRAKVSLSAPGLFLSEKLAGELDLTEAERRDVEDAFARAREKFGRSLSAAVAEGKGNVEAGVVREKRLEAEKEAREALAGRLPEEKLKGIERAQAKAASQSRISISVRRGVVGATKRRHTGPRKGPEPMPPEELQEF